MKKKDEINSNDLKKELEALKKKSKDERYILKLYVTGTTPNSLRSIKNIRKICEEYLKNRYELEIIDIYQQPQLSQGAQIIAAPTLIKKLPLPLRKFVGDLSDVEKVLLGLNIEKKL